MKTIRILIVASVLLASGTFAGTAFAAASGGIINTGGSTGAGSISTGGSTSGGTINTSSSGALQNPLNIGNCGGTGNQSCLSAFLNDILQFIIRIGSIVVILMIVFVGYKFVMAQGSDSKLLEARQMLLWTVVGALILLGAQAISMGIMATVQAITG